MFLGSQVLLHDLIKIVWNLINHGCCNWVTGKHGSLHITIRIHSSEIPSWKLVEINITTSIQVKVNHSSVKLFLSKLIAKSSWEFAEFIFIDCSTLISIKFVKWRNNIGVHLFSMGSLAMINRLSDSFGLFEISLLIFVNKAYIVVQLDGWFHDIK